jgi:hypothetical protein
MKKSVFFLALICIVFAGFTSYAQSVVTLPDLEKLCIKNASDFETFALTKDYSVQSKLSSDVTKVYWCDKANANGKQNTLSRTQIPHASAKVEFTTTDKKWYLDLKALMASTGYKFVNDEKRKIDGIETDMHNFTNGKVHVAVFSWTTDATWFGAQVHL